MKYLGQILSAIVYTPLYTGIMYLAINFAQTKGYFSLNPLNG